MTAAVLVIAKAPVPGRVKTRLCPPCTPRQAAAVAEAALLDTLDMVNLTPAASRTLVLEGRFDPPPGWLVAEQRGQAWPSAWQTRSSTHPRRPRACSSGWTPPR
jgi:uncharacterized protein